MSGDWKISAIDDLMNTTLSIETIARKYGRSASAIRKLRRQHEIVRDVEPRRGPVPKSQRPCLGDRHRSIGRWMRLMRTRDFCSLSEAAMKLDMSTYILQNIEAGTHDITLSQIERVARYCDKDIHDLFQPITCADIRCA